MQKRPRDEAEEAEEPPAKRLANPVVRVNAMEEDEDVITPALSRPTRFGGQKNSSNTLDSAIVTDEAEPILRKSEDSQDGLEEYPISKEMKVAMLAELEDISAPLGPGPEEDVDGDANGFEESDVEDEEQVTAETKSVQPSAAGDSHSDDQGENAIGEIAKTDKGKPTDGTSDKKKFRKKRKRAFYDPHMWPDGAQDPDFYKQNNVKAQRGEEIKCHETGVTLDVDESNQFGTIWWEMQRSALSSGLLTHLNKDYSPTKRGHAPRYARTDFLKACNRLGRMVHPEQLSILLGGRDRHPEYCRFVLAGILGLLNIRKTRQLARGEAKEPKRERPGEVVVRADNEYPSDDELIRSLQNDENDTSLPDSVNEMIGTLVRTFPELPSEGEDDTDRLERQVGEQEVLHLSCKEDDAWNATWSYITRTYFCNLGGDFFNCFSSFAQYASRVGMSFEDAAGVPPCPGVDKVIRRNDRLKWKTEPMPAPELGEFCSVKLSTVELWKSACKSFSVKHMARCSLIQGDRILDWLTLVSHETATSSNEKEFYKDRKPPVSIAPIPMLYLADTAVDVVLKVLGAAVHLARSEPHDEDPDCVRRVITGDDILYAAGWVLGVEERHRVAMHLFSEYVAEFDDTNSTWPQLLKRPLTKSENIIVCDRAPISSINVPLNVVDELQAVLMSLTNPVNRFLYTRGKSMNARGPISLMTPEKRTKEIARLKEVRKKHGISFSVHRGSDKVNGTDKIQDVERSSNDIESTDNGNSSGEVGEGSACAPKPEEIAAIKKQPDLKESSNGYQDMTGATAQSLDRSQQVLCEEDLFVDQVNVAEVVASKIGIKNLLARAKQLTSTTREEQARVTQAMAGGLANFLNTSKHFAKRPSGTVCYHRLGWICLHALGHDAESNNLDDNHAMGYGFTADYTGFGEIDVADRTTMDMSALTILVQLADQIVRQEAEILMSCAAHDDGRPWIDRADIVLVTSVRKERYQYADVGRSTDR